VSPFRQIYGRVFSARPGGRAVSPRWGAISGPSPSAGNRAAGDPGWVNPFLSAHVPMLWQALTQEFPRQVVYWLDGDPNQTQMLTVIWKEGAEDEEVSPGRYSHIYVFDADLPRAPILHDVVSADGVQYDVVRIDAYAYQCSMLVLQDRSEDF
jgi:hypothetical protein